MSKHINWYNLPERPLEPDDNYDYWLENQVNEMIEEVKGFLSESPYTWLDDFIDWDGVEDKFTKQIIDEREQAELERELAKQEDRYL